MKKSSVLVSVLIVVVMIVVFAPAAVAAQDMPSIADIAVENEGFSTLVAAVVAADLVETLDSGGPFTVFAPTDEAFEKFFASLEPYGITPADVLANKELLTSILLYHVAPGEYYASDVLAMGTLTMADGNPATVYVDGGAAYVNGSSMISNVDLAASNGVVHVIDEVMLPPQYRWWFGPVEYEESIVDVALESEGLSTLVAAVVAADLVDTLSGDGPFTVFAPSNDAFEAALSDLGISATDLLADKDLLTGVLLYHVAPGEYFAADVLAEGSLKMADGNMAMVTLENGVVKIDGAPIINPNIDLSNGVVHVIDYIMLPPSNQ